MIKSFFLLCKKKIRKKKKKSSPLFSFGFLGEIDRALSLSLSPRPSPPRRRRRRRRRRLEGTAARSSYHRLERSRLLGVLPLFSTPARAPPPPPRRSKMLPENESKNRIAFWTRIIIREKRMLMVPLLKPIKRRRRL